MTSATYDLEAEQAVLGAFLIEEETWARIGETFSPGALYLKAHHATAAAIIARRVNGDPADPILLRGDLVDAGDRTAADLVSRSRRGSGPRRTWRTGSAWSSFRSGARRDWRRRSAGSPSPTRSPRRRRRSRAGQGTSPPAGRG